MGVQWSFVGKEVCCVCVHVGVGELGGVRGGLCMHLFVYGCLCCCVCVSAVVLSACLLTSWFTCGDMGARGARGAGRAREREAGLGKGGLCGATRMDLHCPHPGAYLSTSKHTFIYVLDVNTYIYLCIRLYI